MNNFGNGRITENGKPFAIKFLIESGTTELTAMIDERNKQLNE